MEEVVENGKEQMKTAHVNNSFKNLCISEFLLYLGISKIIFDIALEFFVNLVYRCMCVNFLM